MSVVTKRSSMEEIMGEHGLGRYTGKLILEPLQGGQQMRTALEFGFLDADGRHWLVPPGTSVDGASIPKALWSLLGLGGPWEGKYREASVVHDYHCAIRSTDWQSTHRVFYHAMLVSGVSERCAKLVYAGVYFAGPRWEDRVVGSERLGRPAIPPQTARGNILYALCRDPSHSRSARPSSTMGRLPLNGSHLNTTQLTGNPRSPSGWISSLIWWKKMPLLCEAWKQLLTML
jgi:hypothetical protein